MLEDETLPNDDSYTRILRRLLTQRRKGAGMQYSSVSGSNPCSLRRECGLFDDNANRCGCNDSDPICGFKNENDDVI